MTLLSLFIPPDLQFSVPSHAPFLGRFAPLAGWRDGELAALSAARRRWIVRSDTPLSLAIPDTVMVSAMAVSDTAPPLTTVSDTGLTRVRAADSDMSGLSVSVADLTLTKGLTLWLTC